MKFPIFLLSAALLLSSSSFARGHKGGHWKKVMEKLELTADQQKQLESIKEKSKVNMKANKEELKQARQNFETSLDQDKSDEEIRTAFQKVRELKAKMAELRFEQMLQIRQILNKDQRQKFRELKRNHHKKRGSHGKY